MTVALCTRHDVILSSQGRYEPCSYCAKEEANPAQTVLDETHRALGHIDEAIKRLNRSGMTLSADELIQIRDGLVGFAQRGVSAAA